MDLKQPGWTVRQGQAVWRHNRSSPEIAGELLIATRPNGDSFVQFTKTPFPLAVGQLVPNRWQIEFPTENRRYTGPGQPPYRIIWLWLAKVLADEPPPKNWKWHQDQKNWRLENPKSGESVEGYFSEQSTSAPGNQ